MTTTEIRRTNALSNWTLQTSFASITPDNFMGVLEGSFLQRIITCPYRICITCTVVTSTGAKPNVRFIVFQCNFFFWKGIATN